MNTAIAALAAQMNVSYADVAAMVAGVIRGIESDKVVDIYLGNESEHVAMCEMYMADYIRKMDRIQIDYLTKPEFSQKLRDFVLALLLA
jgi:hypothetical protein